MNTPYKLSQEEMKELYKEMGSTETMITMIQKALDLLSKEVKELRREVEKVKIAAAITNTKIMFYGAAGSLLLTFVVHLIKKYLSKGVS